MFFENEALEGRQSLKEFSVDAGDAGVGDDKRGEGGERGPFLGKRKVTPA